MHFHFYVKMKIILFHLSAFCKDSSSPSLRHMTKERIWLWTGRLCIRIHNKVKRLLWSKIHDIIFLCMCILNCSYVNMFCCFSTLPLPSRKVFFDFFFLFLLFSLRLCVSPPVFYDCTNHPFHNVSMVVSHTTHLPPTFHHHRHRKTWITRKYISPNMFLFRTSSQFMTAQTRKGIFKEVVCDCVYDTQHRNFFFFIFSTYCQYFPKKLRMRKDMKSLSRN